MRKAIASLVAALVLLTLAPAAHATINMTTPIAMPNVTKWKITRAVPNYTDDGALYLVLVIQPQSNAGSGSLVYGTSNAPWTLIVTDAADTCQTLQLNPTPTGYFDKLVIKTNGVSGAATAIIAAMDAAGGSMASKLRAAETACLSTGVCGPGLAGT